MKPKIYTLIDGKNILWRYTYAMRNLSANGMTTGGILGLLNALASLGDKYGRGPVYVCWEGRPMERIRLFKDYKANRLTPQFVDPMAGEVRRQAEWLEDFLPLVGVGQAISPGWEADDVLATLATRFSNAGHYVHVVTGDRDLYQIVDRSVSVLRPAKRGGFEEVTPKKVYADLGVRPRQVVDYKALVGDPSDNIPGCRGIGPVAAKEILGTYLRLGWAMDCAIASVSVTKGGKGPLKGPWTLRPRWASLIAEQHESIILSRDLATVNREAPLREVGGGSPERRLAAEGLKSLRLFTLVGRLERIIGG